MAICGCARSGLALNPLAEGRRVHLQSHCQCCCQHSSDRQPLQPICCQPALSSLKQDRVGSHAKQDRMGRPGTLSFLQPPCPASMARERHSPAEWSLMMKAFASWKVWKAYWRPRTGAYARRCTVQVSNVCPLSIPLAQSITILQHLMNKG